MRIGVLSHTEKAGRDRPVRHVSRCSAIRWIALGTHKPVDKFTIQEIDPALRSNPNYIAASQRSRIAVEAPEPNIDRRLGVKFVDPAARAMAQTPQLNKLWMGEKVWLATD